MGITCYLDVPGFLASQPALPLNGLLGGNTTLSTATLAGATTLPVQTVGAVGLAPGFQADQPVYILDGAQTEIVLATTIVSATTPPTITLGANLTNPGVTGCQYAHAAGVSVSSGGAMGALGDTLIAASSWVEEYCEQGSPTDRGFIQATRTETLMMPSTRAYINRGYGLVIRPHWYPITAISAVSIEIAPGAGTPFQPSQVEIDTSGLYVSIPQLTPVSGGYPTLGGFTFYNRGATQWARITYTAGFVPGSLPWAFLRAVSFAAREYIAYAQNPTGAAMIRQGDVQLMQRLRGSGGKESSIDSVFLSQAKTMLSPWKAQAM